MTESGTEESGEVKGSCRFFRSLSSMIAVLGVLFFIFGGGGFMTRLLLLIFILLFGVTFHVAAEGMDVNLSAPRFALLDTEDKSLLSEYAKAYPKIKNFYENIRMDVNVKTTHYHSAENLKSLRLDLESAGLNENEIEEHIMRSSQMERQYEVRYRQSDKYARVDTRVNIPIDSSVQADLPPEIRQRGFIQEVEVALFTPAKGYQFSKMDSSKHFFSLNVQRDFEKRNAKGIVMATMYFDKAPFCSDRRLLDEYLFQNPPLLAGKPHGIMEYIQQKEMGGTQIVEIKNSRSDDPTGVFTVIKLDKDSWGVKESYISAEIFYPNGEKRYHWCREKCTYDGVVNGVPLLKTYQRSEGEFDKDTKEEIVTRIIECEVTNLVPGPPDLSEFDVAQFLPPGVKVGEDITFAHFSPARIAAIVLGVIFIILGIYFHFRRARG